MNNEQQHAFTVPVRLFVCGECGASMRRVDATETHVIYRCTGKYGHVFWQPRQALRFRTGRNEPNSAA